MRWLRRDRNRAQAQDKIGKVYAAVTHHRALTEDLTTPQGSSAASRAAFHPSGRRLLPLQLKSLEATSAFERLIEVFKATTSLLLLQPAATGRTCFM